MATEIVGNAPLEFLYENRGYGTSIELKPGVMFSVRRFHELITDFVRGAWLRYVRRFNGQVLGAPNDLDQFLFGPERAPLAKIAGNPPRGAGRAMSLLWARCRAEGGTH
jgi:hypothetical protein